MPTVATEEMCYVGTEEMPSVATEEMSSAAPQELSSLATEEIVFCFVSPPFFVKKKYDQALYWAESFWSLSQRNSLWGFVLLPIALLVKGFFLICLTFRNRHWERRQGEMEVFLANMAYIAGEQRQADWEVSPTAPPAPCRGDQALRSV